MKKKFLALAMVAALTMASLAGCGSGDKTPADTSKSTSGSTGTSDVKPEKTIKVGMVTDVGGVNDGSFNQSSWAGLQKAGDELGVEVKYLESKTDADYTPNIETFVDDSYDLIICVGYKLADATKTAAENYPDTKFAIIDDSTNADLPNVTCLMFEQEQASYLAGVIAAMATKSNKVGFVLGMSNETMNQFGYGYAAGVIDTKPDCEIIQYNANAFNDTAGGKSAVTSMVTNGADVIFHAAGGTGLGVIEGCKDNGIWAIGVDTDQSAIAPDTIITSAMKRVDTASYEAAKACLEGTLKSGVITYDLETSGVDIAPTTDNLTDEMIKAVEEVKAKVISGEITVPKTQEDFDAKYGDVYELD